MLTVHEYSDNTIECQVALLLHENTLLSAYVLQPTVDNGTVYLKGIVHTPTEKELAGNLASTVAGVRAVVNNLTVNTKMHEEYAENGWLHNVTDALVTAIVKSQLLIYPGTGGVNVHVKTHDGVVSLAGQVGSLIEKEQAEKVALGTRGVEAVRNDLVVGNGL
jgi:hyperosmotically inducible periplasmic protein